MYEKAADNIDIFLQHPTSIDNVPIQCCLQKTVGMLFKLYIIEIKYHLQGLGNFS